MERGGNRAVVVDDTSFGAYVVGSAEVVAFVDDLDTLFAVVAVLVAEVGVVAVAEEQPQFSAGPRDSFSVDDFPSLVLAWVFRTLVQLVFVESLCRFSWWPKERELFALHHHHHPCP